MTNFASIAVEIPEHFITGVADGVLAVYPPLLFSYDPNPNVGTLGTQRGSVAWIYGGGGAALWFTGCMRRLAVYVGGSYVMQTAAPISSGMGSGGDTPVDPAVLPAGWTLLAIL